MFNLAVLSSGMSRGSNLLAMTDYFREHNLPIQIIFVIRTKEDAPIAEVCYRLNIACHYLPYKDKQKFEEKVLYLINYHNIHLIALAGFLKMLSPEFISDSGVPILNIHPALLPKYGGKAMYGMNVHKAVFASKEKVSGATVHLVDEKYDHGQIVAQQQIDISGCKSPEDVSKLVLTVEHQLYGKAILDYLQKLYS
jgi:phosphoribosylglycinamide formyltransferase-1